MADPPNGTSNTTKKEVSIQEAMAKFLTDESLNDVTLRGSDGVEVPANRYLLAARSEVFHRMLFCQNEGGYKANVVEIPDFQGDVLRVVVEYVYTDDHNLIVPASWLKEKRPKDYLGDTLRVQMLVAVTDASSFFNLPGLGTAAVDVLNKSLWRWPRLNLAFLDACEEAPNGPPALIPQELRERAVKAVRSSAYKGASLTKDHVACLSPHFLEKMFQDTKLEMTPLERFDFLRLWAEAVPEEASDRRKCALALSKYISIAQIDSQILNTTVKASGLVSEEQMASAQFTQMFEQVTDQAGCVLTDLDCDGMFRDLSALVRSANCAVDTRKDELESQHQIPVVQGFNVVTTAPDA